MVPEIFINFGLMVEGIKDLSHESDNIQVSIYGNKCPMHKTIGNFRFCNNVFNFRTYTRGLKNIADMVYNKY